MSSNTHGIGIGLVGAGYWGPNVLRNLYASGRWNIRALCDLDQARLLKASAPYPSLTTTTEYTRLLEDPLIKAIAIATPLETHYGLADAALRAGKDVLVEKPMTGNATEAAALCSLAEAEKRVLMVDHTYLVNPAVEYLKELHDCGDLGDVLYIDTVRVNLGLFQQHGDVIMDLAPHDISIVNFLLDATPTHAATIVSSCINPEMVDVAYISLYYPGNVLVHAHLSWLSPVKVRRMSIAGRNKMAVWDDLDTDRIRIYDKGIVLPPDPEVARVRQMVGYRLGDMLAPNLSRREPLEGALDEFYQAVVYRQEPRSSARFGLDVVRVLDAITNSIAHHGRRVEVGCSQEMAM
jgi:predicted dehydrogenase